MFVYYKFFESLPLNGSRFSPMCDFKTEMIIWFDEKSTKSQDICNITSFFCKIQCSQLFETKYGQWHWKLWPIWPRIMSNMATIWPRFQWILTLISVFIAFLCDNFCKNFKLEKIFYKSFSRKISKVQIWKF